MSASTSAEVYAQAERVGMSRDAADSLMYEEGIPRAAELLAELPDKAELERRAKAADITHMVAAFIRNGGSFLAAARMILDSKPREAAPATEQAPAKAPVYQFTTTDEELKQTFAKPAPTNGAARPAKKERKRNSPGFVKPRREGRYIDPARGYFSMYNALTDTNLLAALSAPLLRAYVYAHRLANPDGTFAVSQATVAQKIGAKTVRHGERVMKRLQQVGLIRLVTRGSGLTKTSNIYQLVPLVDLDLTKVKAALAE
jgi:hypothetical protein